MKFNKSYISFSHMRGRWPFQNVLATFKNGISCVFITNAAWTQKALVRKRVNDFKMRCKAN